MGIKLCTYINENVCGEDKKRFEGEFNKSYSYKKINLDKLSTKSKNFNKNNNINLNDFQFLNLIGKGGYGKVFLAENTINKQLYAIKSISILQKNNKDNIKNIITEKKILSKASHPFIMNLNGFIISNKKLFFIMDYQENGDLYTLFKIYKKFPINLIKFITVELIIGLEYLHNNLNVIYRDLKLQNIWISKNGHIKITDFGLSKYNSNEGHTFCGTISFIAPEVFKNNYNKQVDYWTLGCLIYYMATGKPPFDSKNHQQLLQLIKLGKFNLDLISDNSLKDLLIKLIEIDPTKRINSINIKNHEFFNNVSFTILDIIDKESPLLYYIKELKYKEDSNRSLNFSQEKYFKSIIISNNSIYF